VRERAWLSRMIMFPDKLIEEKDPIATALFKQYKEIRMPRLNLAQEDVNTLIEFMKIQTASVGSGAKSKTQN